MTSVQSGCVVVLDTGPVRDLAHCSQIPSWVGSFSRMKADGYRFSLADCACAELINQRSRGSIKDPGFSIMIDCLGEILDPTLPVMLGDRDVLIMIGARSRDEKDLPATEVSQCVWSKLRKQPIDYDNRVEEVLQEDRDAWKELFRRVNEIYLEKGSPTDLNEYDHPILDVALASMNDQANISPPLSIRLDLRMRYFWRQFVRSKKDRGAYNLEAPKKHNDGIDFSIYMYLALPALVVVTEHGFLKSIADIRSFQASWFQKPSTLVEAWTKGERPQPTWP
jgi:hypothetical protein